MKPMRELQLSFLGELKVCRGPEELVLPPSRKTRGLLAYLVLNQRAFRREQLCELLWEIPDDPRGSLRWSLSKLRRLVDDEEHARIVADRTHVSFDAGTAQIDIAELQGLAGNSLDDMPLAELKDAADRLRGEFLEGLELPNFHDFHSWCIGQREQANRCQAQLLQALLDKLQSDPEQAVGYAQRLVELQPYDEAVHAGLVGHLQSLGRRQEAEQQCKAALHLLGEAGQAPSGILHKALNEARATQLEQRPSWPASKRLAIEHARSSSELFGRDSEVTTLVNHFNDACELGQSRMVLLRGEPGIGKSRLLQVAAELALEVDTLLLRADAFESEIVRPFALWNDAFRLSPQGAIPELLSGDDRIERDQLFSGLSDLLAAEATLRTVTIAFDDLQWCDESSAAALHYILRMNRDLPVVVLGSAREQELRDNQPMQQALRGLRHENLLYELELGPLPDQDLRDLVHSEAPDIDAERLVAECGGNPLLAIELARASSRGDRADSLSELVQERLARMDKKARETVLWASVLAPNIHIKPLGRMTGLDIGDLDIALDGATSQGMLVPVERGYRFSHDLIARSVYDEISPARRMAMHRRLAEQLEVDTALDLKLAADLAHHATKSGDPALAARSMVSAGRLCLRYYANEDALNLALSGLEFARELPDAERVCLTLELTDIRVSASPIEDWEAAADECVELAEEALDHGALPSARLGYHLASYLRWIHGDWSDAQRDTLQAERVTRGASDEEHIIGMAETAKCLALLERDLSRADAMLMEAHALASRKQVNSSAIPTASGILRYYENKLDDAEELLQEARTLSKAQGDRINEFQANEYLAMIEIERGDHRAATQRCKTLLGIGEKLGQGSELPFARALQALLQFASDGDHSALLQALAPLRDVDAKHRLSYVLNRAAFVDLEHGRLEDAREHASEALQCSQTLSRPSEMIMAHTALAYAYEGLGQEEQKQEHVLALRELGQAGVARWAKNRAAPFLGQE